MSKGSSGGSGGGGMSSSAPSSSSGSRNNSSSISHNSFSPANGPMGNTPSAMNPWVPHRMLPGWMDNMMYYDEYSHLNRQSLMILSESSLRKPEEEESRDPQQPDLRIHRA